MRIYQKGISLNTGITQFKKGMIPWNKGKKVIITKNMKAYYKRKNGISMPKPSNFSETMRNVNPPIGIKKKFGNRDKQDGLKVWRDGYIFVYKPEHPSSRKVRPDYGYILEHRMVIEDFIKRQLTKEEVIHHIDGNKSNNKIENLLLCTNSKEHNHVHIKMQVFVEKLIREGKVFYDKESKEFKFR